MVSHMTYKVYVKLHNTLACNYARLVYKRFKSDYFVFKFCYCLRTYYGVTSVGHAI
jgi:hypothetical protein